MTSGTTEAPSTPARRRRRPIAVLSFLAGAVAVAVGAVLVLTTDLGRPPRVTIGGSPLLGKPAPEIDLLDVEGRRMRLSDYRGRPVIVNFWATWCEPCKVEFPLFRDARARHSRDGLEILGVIHDDSVDAARAFAASRDADWPMLDDREDVAYRAYGALLLPTSFYVDRDGIVRAVSFGPPPSGVLDDQLAKILPAAPTPGVETPSVTTGP